RKTVGPDGFTVGDRTFSIQRAYEWAAQQVWGTPYTNYDMYRYRNEIALREMRGDYTPEQATEAVRALNEGNLSHELVRDVIDDVIYSSSKRYLAGRLGMLSGQEYDP